MTTNEFFEQYAIGSRVVDPIIAANTSGMLLWGSPKEYDFVRINAFLDDLESIYSVKLQILTGLLHSSSQRGIIGKTETENVTEMETESENQSKNESVTVNDNNYSEFATIPFTDTQNRIKGSSQGKGNTTQEGNTTQYGNTFQIDIDTLNTDIQRIHRILTVAFTTKFVNVFVGSNN